MRHRGAEIQRSQTEQWDALSFCVSVSHVVPATRRGLARVSIAESRYLSQAAFRAGCQGRPVVSVLPEHQFVFDVVVFSLTYLDETAGFVCPLGGDKETVVRGRDARSASAP